MTTSGTPSGDQAGPEQEGIWDEPTDVSPATVIPADPSHRARPGLTGRLTSTAHTPGPAGLLYADVPNRIVALVLDVIVLSVVGVLLAVLVGWTDTTGGGAINPSGGFDVAAFLLVLLAQLAVSFAYFGSLWTLAGATAGMRLLGLRIGDEADGRRVSWRASFVRWLIVGVPSLLSSLAVYVPNAIGQILAGVGLAWLLLLLYTMAQSPTKQGLHDRYAHTIVTRARRRAV